MPVVPGELYHTCLDCALHSGWVQSRPGVWNWHERLGFWRGRGLKTEQRAPILAEAIRIHESWNEHLPLIPRGLPIDHTAWLVYADWLEENEYPINATAVRQTHEGKLCGSNS